MNDLPVEEVRGRIDARLAAETVASLADEEALVHGKLFWVQLHKICCAHVPCSKEEEQQKRTMTDAESRQFGAGVMPFGEYAGKRIDEVPLDRLEWYTEQSFVDSLRRYLRSRRIQSEQ